MSDINLYPENDPGGNFGDDLRFFADSLSHAVRPYVEASDAAALAAVEQGDEPLPDPGVAELVLGLEDTVNAMGARYRATQNLSDRIAKMSPDEFVAAAPELGEVSPTCDWAGLYDRKRDPGKIGKFFRPVLRALGLEPPYWR